MFACSSGLCDGDIDVLDKSFLGIDVLYEEKPLNEEQQITIIYKEQSEKYPYSGCCVVEEDPHFLLL